MVRLLTGRPTTAECMVHTILQQRILDGELRPGERIDLDTITRELAVSRTPIRTALRQLESEGLVIVYPHRAVLVSELSSEDLEQVYAVRIHLEKWAAQLAVPHLTDADLTKLRGIHQEIIQVIKGANLASFTEKDRAFHLALYRAANNQFLSRLIDDLRKSSLRFISTDTSVERLQRTVVEHEQIIDAAEARDTDQVVALIQKNLERTGEAISAFLRVRANSIANEHANNAYKKRLPSGLAGK